MPANQLPAGACRLASRLRTHPGVTVMSQSKPLFPLNARYAVVWDHEIKHALSPRKICNRTWWSTAPLPVRWSRLKTPAGTGWCRCRWASCAATMWCAASRAGLQHAGALRAHALAGHHQPLGLRAQLPVAKKHRCVWIWPGDPAWADARLIPDLHWRTTRPGPAMAAPSTPSATTGWCWTT